MQTESWHRKGMCCPQEGLQAHRRVVWSLQGALHQPACKLSAHPTSLLQKSRKKKWQSLPAIGLRSKEKADSLSSTYPRHNTGICSLPLLWCDSQGSFSGCTWNISYMCTCLGGSLAWSWDVLCFLSGIEL